MICHRPRRAGLRRAPPPGPDAGPIVPLRQRPEGDRRPHPRGRGDREARRADRRAALPGLHPGPTGSGGRTTPGTRWCSSSPGSSSNSDRTASASRTSPRWRRCGRPTASRSSTSSRPFIREGGYDTYDAIEKLRVSRPEATAVHRRADPKDIRRSTREARKAGPKRPPKAEADTPLLDAVGV